MVRWSVREAGVLELPSGRTLRGRRLRGRPGDATPDLTLHLAAFAPRRVHGPTRWIRWPDFAVPVHRRAAAATLRDAWARSDLDRIDVACRGGRGRTGTALACMAVLDGMEPAAAIALVRDRYDRRAVETRGQERYVRTFGMTPSTP